LCYLAVLVAEDLRDVVADPVERHSIAVEAKLIEHGAARPDDPLEPLLRRTQRLFGATAIRQIAGEDEPGATSTEFQRARADFDIDQRSVARSVAPHGRIGGAVRP